MTRPWRFDQRSMSAADAVAAGSHPLGDERRVVSYDVTDSAIVLGSTQPEPPGLRARAAARGLTVLRRRSGGGAVIIEPGGQLWVDVELPRTDPLWCEDVVRSFGWLGEAWRAALEALEIDATVHPDGYEPGPWGATVCFAGRGPGEVFVEGAKAVGIAQRRIRSGARYQCAVPRVWPGERYVELLDLAPVASAALRGAVHPVAPAGLGEALLAHLPSR